MLLDVPTLLRACSIGEVAWRDGDRIRVRGALPLPGPAGPALAFPYADEEVARSLGAAREVVLTLTETRSTARAFVPAILRGTPALSEDREGDRFCDELLDEELRRYPPSRLLADSHLLRRENWWWLPRLIVDLRVTSAEPFHARTTPADHLLVVSDGDRLDAAVARVEGDTGDAVVVEVLEGSPGPGDAVLFGQDASFPDLEQWGGWSWEGRWDGVGFTATTHPARIGLPPVPGVLARWRRHRELEKACRAALA